MDNSLPDMNTIERDDKIFDRIYSYFMSGEGYHENLLQFSAILEKIMPDWMIRRQNIMPDIENPRAKATYLELVRMLGLNAMSLENQSFIAFYEAEIFKPDLESEVNGPIDKYLIESDLINISMISKSLDNLSAEEISRLKELFEKIKQEVREVIKDLI